MNYNNTNRKIAKLENTINQNNFKLIDLKLDYKFLSNNQGSQIDKYEVFSEIISEETNIDLFISLPGDMPIQIINMVQVFPYIEIDPPYINKLDHLNLNIISGIKMNGNIPEGINIHMEVNFNEVIEGERIYYPLYLTIYLMGKSRREADEIRRNKS
jgi:hypothetical protein